MTILASDGTTVLTKTALLAKTTDVPTEYATVNEDIYETFNYDPYRDNFSTFEGEKRLRYKAGQVVRKSDINALFPTATFVSISPASGAAAGGTPVTVKGTHFAGVTGFSIGGNAVTSFQRVNDTTIKGTTAAHATGATDVVIADDAGNVTATNAFTFV